MNNYIDKYGRYHNKPVTDSNSVPSNNGWIYTAYSDKAELPVDKELLRQCYNDCLIYDIDKEFSNYSATRSPGKIVPPLSRDEVLGICYFQKSFRIDLQNWNFSPYPIPKFSLVKLVKQLWELRPTFYPVVTGDIEPDPKTFGGLYIRHRNYVWQNNLDQLYRFTFSVPLQDRHFILKKWNLFKSYNPIHLFYATIAKIDFLLPKKSGIKWLKYGGDKNKETMKLEFPEDHPIRE